MKHTRKSIRNKKGINTILAALLMVVIVVVAAVMVYAWSTGLLGTLLVNPNNNKEGPLNLDTNAAFPTGNNVTLYIRNAGTLGVTLTSFYITDASNDIWQDVAWTSPGSGIGPTINPNAVATVTISINQVSGNCWTSVAVGSGVVGATTGTTPCSNVAGSGGTGAGTFNGGTFTSGQYTVKVITQRNNPFAFTITK